MLGPNSPTEHGGQVAAPEVLSAGATAVLAYNDLVAIGLIEGLAELGVEVPDAISVVGIDDIMPARMGRPKLTTIAMPTVAAGRTAVDMLLQLVGSTEPSGAAQTSRPRSSSAAWPIPAPPPGSRLTREAS
ncbi:hypothetical protein GCM10009780_19360 [Actinomadura alba]